MRDLDGSRDLTGPRIASLLRYDPQRRLEKGRSSRAKVAVAASIRSARTPRRSARTCAPISPAPPRRSSNPDNHRRKSAATVAALRPIVWRQCGLDAKIFGSRRRAKSNPSICVYRADGTVCALPSVRLPHEGGSAMPSAAPPARMTARHSAWPPERTLRWRRRSRPGGSSSRTKRTDGAGTWSGFCGRAGEEIRVSRRSFLVRVLAEVLFARIAGRDLRYQVARFDLARSRGDPDVSVREFADTRLRMPDALRVVHSTSWRYERRRIVLSYSVFGSSTFATIAAARLVRGLTEARRESARRDRAVLSRAASSRLSRCQEPREYTAKLGPETRRALRRLRPAAAGRVRHRG